MFAAWRSATPLPAGVQIGATGSRLLAALVEVGPVWLLVCFALLFGAGLEGRGPLAVLSCLLGLGWAVFVWSWRATKAAGPGMRLDSLQIVGCPDGQPIGWRRVLLRSLVFAALSMTGIGLVAMLIAMGRHPYRQGWHDLVVAAVVIKELPPLPVIPSSASTPTTAATPDTVPAPVTASAPSTASTTAGRTESTVPAVSAEPTPVWEYAGPTAAHLDRRLRWEEGRDCALRLQEAGVEFAFGSGRGKPADLVKHVPTLVPPLVPPAPERSATWAASAIHPATEVPPPSVGPAPEHAWWLRLDDGRDIGIDGGLVLLGRNPQPRMGEEDALLIKVVDKGRTVSKSHLAIGLDARGLFVVDRGSTNGTTVTSPDGTRRHCPPGDQIGLTGGSVISFGDHRLQVRRTRP